MRKVDEGFGFAEKKYGRPVLSVAFSKGKMSADERGCLLYDDIEKLAYKRADEGLPNNGIDDKPRRNPVVEKHHDYCPEYCWQLS